MIANRVDVPQDLRPGATSCGVAGHVGLEDLHRAAGLKLGQAGRRAADASGNHHLKPDMLDVNMGIGSSEPPQRPLGRASDPFDDLRPFHATHFARLGGFFSKEALSAEAANRASSFRSPTPCVCPPGTGTCLQAGGPEDSAKPAANRI
ncbi:hypothetical protein G7043_07310 [Lentzea sp. NEAU-D13]|uniref:Uncharacterized protein n=1 Tax=Lentzea alba TaxID=2714351 RepID=A0A7C9VLU7_9PSEU|nr:hypothetical protein [Lentzea alba]NGY58733.1 hypothetical protein [Lentzea alba]